MCGTVLQIHAWHLRFWFWFGGMFGCTSRFYLSVAPCPDRVCSLICYYLEQTFVISLSWLSLLDLITLVLPAQWWAATSQLNMVWEVLVWLGVSERVWWRTKHQNNMLLRPGSLQIIWWEDPGAALIEHVPSGTDSTWSSSTLWILTYGLSHTEKNAGVRNSQEYFGTLSGVTFHLSAPSLSFSQT